MSSISETERPSSGDQQDRSGHQLVFVGGMHRSGTTLVADAIGAGPRGSGLVNTGVMMDEGQHLQSVYVGGRGEHDRWAFAPWAHLTESDADGDVAERLWAAWSPYWDLRRTYLVEKSPPNLTKMRYLQEAFPSAKFVAVTRHPVVQALAIRKWARRSTGRFGFGLPRLVEHWVHAHDLFTADAPRLKRLCVIRYEHLMSDPRAELCRLETFLGTRLPTEVAVDSGRSADYARVWSGATRRELPARVTGLLRRAGRRPWRAREPLAREVVDAVMIPQYRREIDELYGERIRAHGYDPFVLDAAEAWHAPE